MVLPTRQQEALDAGGSRWQYNGHNAADSMEADTTTGQECAAVEPHANGTCITDYGEAASLLISIMELIEDSGVEEALGTLDACFESPLAAWEPPWGADGVDSLTLQGLAHLPRTCVIQSVLSFTRLLDSLVERAGRASSEQTQKVQLVVASNAEHLTVVLPDQTTTWQGEVVRRLVGLVGGQCMQWSAWHAQSQVSSVLPCSTRIILLSSLGAPVVQEEFGPDKDTSANALQFSTIMKPGFLVKEGPLRQAPSSCVREDTRSGAVEQGARCQEPLPQDCARSTEAPAPTSPCIQFIHLHALRVAANSLGEAAGLIVGAMHLLSHILVQNALAVLDDLSGGLLAAWKPPWLLEGIEDVNADSLSRFPESTLFGWAMNVDGFVSFLAKLASAAMKGGWVPGLGFPSSCAALQVEEVGPEHCQGELAPTLPPREDREAHAANGLDRSPPEAVDDFPRGATPFSNFAPPREEAACVCVDAEEDEGWEVESSSSAHAARALEPTGAAEAEEPEQASKAERPGVSAIVVVLPDLATRWHLEVIGALVSSLGVFMIYENAWRADFAGASNVPFLVEALPAGQREGGSADRADLADSFSRRTDPPDACLSRTSAEGSVGAKPLERPR